VAGPQSIIASAAGAEPEDEGLELLRLDAAQRRRAGVAVGDVVDVERYQVPAASLVRVMMVGQLAGELDAESLRQKLSAQPIMVGDSIAVAQETSHFEARVNILGLTVAEVEGDATGCGALLARVLETQPRGLVQVTHETEIELTSGDVPPDGSDDM
jgi:transitional endoplasmic reticulum ATPase